MVQQGLTVVEQPNCLPSSLQHSWTCLVLRQGAVVPLLLLYPGKAAGMSAEPAPWGGEGLEVCVHFCISLQGIPHVGSHLLWAAPLHSLLAVGSAGGWLQPGQAGSELGGLQLARYG